jgi:hypothetical protein
MSTVALMGGTLAKPRRSPGMVWTATDADPGKMSANLAKKPAIARPARQHTRGSRGMRATRRITGRRTC